MIYVLIAGIAGLLPDMDIPASWIFNLIFKTNYSFHRIYTHSLLYAIAFFAVAMIFLILKKEKYEIFNFDVRKEAIYLFFFAMSFGWFTHIAFDCALLADGYLNLTPSIPLSFCPHPFSRDVLVGFDAVILVLWLLHEQYRHDIVDYF